MKDFVLIQGYVLNEDGSIDEILKARMDHFLRRAASGLETRSVIVAGKHGKRDKAYVERTGITEAQTMQDYLTGNGVAPDKVLLEPNGTNTWDCTVRAYKDIIKPREFSSGTVVSNIGHLPRIIYQTIQIFPGNLMQRTEFEGPYLGEKGEASFLTQCEFPTVGITLDSLKEHAARVLTDR